MKRFCHYLTLLGGLGFLCYLGYIAPPVALMPIFFLLGALFGLTLRRPLLDYLRGH